MICFADCCYATLRTPGTQVRGFETIPAGLVHDADHHDCVSGCGLDCQRLYSEHGDFTASICLVRAWIVVCDVVPERAHGVEYRTLDAAAH